MLDEKLTPETWGFGRWLAERWRGGINRLSALLRLPLGPLRRLRQRAWRGARGCNLAIWRSDLDRVDGFDADYSGWGKEDSDIIVRLMHAGVRRKDGMFATGVLHLWHAGRPSPLAQNERKLSDIIASDDVRAQARTVRDSSRRYGCFGRVNDVHAFDRITFRPRAARQIADCLAVAVAVSLPWSTSATGILLVLWLLALIPTLDWDDLRRELVTPAGGLPVLLVLLGVLGMAWADVSFGRALGRCRLILQAAGDPAAARAIPPLGARSWVLGGYARVLRRSAGASWSDLLGPRIPSNGRCTCW